MDMYKKYSLRKKMHGESESPSDNCTKEKKKYVKKKMG